MTAICDICNGMWSEDRIIHITRDGQEQKVCADCLKASL